MEAHRPTQAMIAALRCWQAMRETQDEETRRSLWRAAVKYGRKAREDARRLETASALAEDAKGGLGLAGLRAFEF